MSTFGERLKQKRIEKELTQSELAELVGCVSQAISQYESGAFIPRRHGIIEGLCDVLGVTESWLFGGFGEADAEAREQKKEENRETAKAKTQIIYYAKDERQLKDIELLISHLRSLDVSMTEKKAIHHTLSEIRRDLENRVLFGVGEIIGTGEVK